MMKSMLWLGVVCLAIGAVVFGVFVLPRVGSSAPVSVLLNGQVTNGPSTLAVAISSVGLAGGATLLGIGLGRWSRPRPSPHDGSPEV